MARVEWTRLEPGDVEHVIAVMLSRENPAAQRIRPSRGDGGIDIAAPGLIDGTVDVHQVKSFSSNLSASQKRQVERSFGRLKGRANARELAVANWRLIMPLDATPENNTWWAALTAGSGFGTEWRGLAYVEGLAAKYPDVIDYYLRDGKDRLQAAVAALTEVIRVGGQAMRGESSAPEGWLSPLDSTSTLQALHAELNRYDPHYRYDFSVDAHRPDVAVQPGMVFATQFGDDERTITFRVYARFAGATDERPIPIQVRWKLDADSTTAAHLRDWVEFGTPFETPLGPADLKLDLPGGLGGEFAGAAVTLGPAASGLPYELRAELVGPDDDVVASVRLDMSPVTQGLTGIGFRASGTESCGVFSIEMRLRDSQHMSLSISPNEIKGARPAEALAGLRFLSVFAAPNQLRFARPYGPTTMKALAVPLESPPSAAEGDLVLELVEALTTIQAHTTEQILVPDFEQMRCREAAVILRVARLLRGERVKIQWESFEIQVRRDSLDRTSGPVSFLFDGPIMVPLSGKSLEVGWCRTQILAAHREEVIDHGGGEAEVAARFSPFGGNNESHVQLIERPDAGR